jgi:hypothetical protein
MILIAGEYKTWNEGNMHVKNEIGIKLRLGNRGCATVVTPDFSQLVTKLLNLFCHRKKRMLNIVPGNANYAITVLPLYFITSTTKC